MFATIVIVMTVTVVLMVSECGSNDNHGDASRGSIGGVDCDGDDGGGGVVIV